MGPSVLVAIPGHVSRSSLLVRPLLSALKVEWKDEEDFFWFGEEDPSPFGIGIQEAEWLDDEETILLGRLSSLARWQLVVGSMCNGDLDHRRLATVAGAVASALETLVVAEFSHPIPRSVAIAGWYQAIPDTSSYRYAMEPIVLKTWAVMNNFRFIK